MKESVIYQDIVQKEALKIVNRQIKKRFGEVNDSLMTQIRDLSADELEDLGEALFDFSEIANLAAWLERNSILASLYIK
ncbi:DUF4351 domain-containing protein [Nostoc sp. CCY0012]|uniref:DUF4351 domain-containing protein n=1 Tax=Nostoc sp. CCY0012 TaxID=1056123 RepID=UPI0039C6A009